MTGVGLWNTDKELVSDCIFVDQFITLALGFVGGMSKVLVMQQQTFVSDEKLMQRGSVCVRGG